MNTALKQRLLGGFFLSLAASIWGGVYVVSKIVLDVIPPFTLLEIRFLIASIVLGIFVVARKEYVERKDLPLMMAIGFVGITISISAQFVGTKLSSAHMGALITSASPAFIAIFAVLLLRERLNRFQIAGMVLAMIGVATVLGVSDDTGVETTMIGNLILFVAAVSWGLYTVLGKRATQRYTSLTVTVYAAFFGLIFTSPAMVWELSVTPVNWGFGWEIYAGILYIGIISTAIAFYLWNKGFEMLHAGSGATFFFFQPFVGTLLGWLLLGEHLTVSFFIGAIFIVLGVSLSNIQKGNKQQ